VEITALYSYELLPSNSHYILLPAPNLEVSALPDIQASHNMEDSILL